MPERGVLPVELYMELLVSGCDNYRRIREHILFKYSAELLVMLSCSNKQFILVCETTCELFQPSGGLIRAGEVRVPKFNKGQG